MESKIIILPGDASCRVEEKIARAQLSKPHTISELKETLVMAIRERNWDHARTIREVIKKMEGV